VIAAVKTGAMPIGGRSKLTPEEIQILSSYKNGNGNGKPPSSGGGNNGGGQGEGEGEGEEEED
jgi:hypothetical protein